MKDVIVRWGLTQDRIIVKKVMLNYVKQALYHLKKKNDGMKSLGGNKTHFKNYMSMELRFGWEISFENVSKTKI
jgi:hypothetical protein